MGKFASGYGLNGLHELGAIEPTHVEPRQRWLSPPWVKLSQAALRMFFDRLVVGQVMPMNPASLVRKPRRSVRKGKTPVLAAEEARALLDAIDVSMCRRFRGLAIAHGRGRLPKASREWALRSGYGSRMSTCRGGAHGSG